MSYQHFVVVAVQFYSNSERMLYSICNKVATTEMFVWIEQKSLSVLSSEWTVPKQSLLLSWWRIEKTTEMNSSIDRKATSLSEIRADLFEPCICPGIPEEVILSCCIYNQDQHSNHQTMIPRFHQEPMEIVDLLCLQTTTYIFGITKFAKMAFSCEVSKRVVNALLYIRKLWTNQYYSVQSRGVRKSTKRGISSAESWHFALAIKV